METRLGVITLEQLQCNEHTILLMSFFEENEIIYHHMFNSF